MRRLFAALAFAASLAGCAAGPPLPPRAEAPEEARPTRVAHVLSNGWHTAIVVPRAEAMATGSLPEAADFPGAAYLQFGWGDREYYQAPEASIGMTLRAALIPTPSVMHVVGRARSPEPRPDRPVVEVGLTEAGFRRMVAAIGATFARPEGARAEPLAPGAYSGGRFYHAEGKFHLFNTCNTWTARILRAGGVELSPAGVITAGEAMERLRDAVGERRAGWSPA